MRMKRLSVAMSLSAIVLFAADRDQAPVRTVQTVVRATRQDAGITQYLVALPHIAFGGPWRTQVVIGNTSGTAADVTLYYFGNDGNPLSLPIGGGFSDHTALTVPANGEQMVEPDWQSTTTAEGWAGLVYTNAGVKIQGVFLWHNSTDPADKYTEAAVPIINQSGSGCLIPLPGSASYTMPYDETGGQFSGYGFANTISGPVTVNLTFYDQNGQVIGQYSEQLPAFGHDSFLLKDKLPQLVGQKGTMVIGGQGIVPLGFRFTQYFTFTTWQP